MLRHAMQETAFVIHNVSTCSVEIMKSCNLQVFKVLLRFTTSWSETWKLFCSIGNGLCLYFDGLCAKQLQHSLLHAKPLTTHEDPGGMFWSVNDMPVLGGFWTTMIVKQFTRRWPLLVVGELIAVYDSLRAPIRKPWELPNQTKLAREHTVGILQGSLQVRLCCFLVRFPSL